MNKRETLNTEQQNINSESIDEFPISKILETINLEDQTVASAVEKVLPDIEVVVSYAKESLINGGRVFYIGAGTSGRLGVLDASECPPTYSVPNDWFIGLIAGGDNALRKSIEGAEDDPVARELFTEGGRDRDAVEDSVDRHLPWLDPREDLSLMERNPQLLVGLEELRIDLIEALRPVFFGGREVVDVLKVNRRIRDRSPVWLRHRKPEPIGLEAPLEEPRWLFFFGGDKANDLFAQALGRELALDLSDEAVLILLLFDKALDLTGALLI